MMTKIQHALGKLAEEASEVAQRALKAQQFGMDEVQPGKLLNNAERLMMELRDLKAAEFRLMELGALCSWPDDQLVQHIRTKDAKVERFYELSRSLGQVE